ncbi:MAG: hypothetical protein ACK4MM_04095 [Fervidobacterium sp.]
MLFLAWIFLFVITLVYFTYYVSGISEKLWKIGIWFNANDVLHIGLIIWCIYFLKSVKPFITSYNNDVN